MNKKIFIISVIICIIILFANISLAGFADFDDEAAKKQTEELIKEQEKNQNQEIEKSNNNYLAELKVEGYKITPEFDKQIQDYKIEENIDKDSISINVKLDDDTATVSGNGLVELQNGENKIRIDITSQRGSVRTYFISLNCSEGKKVEKEEKEETVEDIKLQESNKLEETNKKQDNSIWTIIIICIVIIVLVFIIFKNICKNKKKKRIYR